MTANRVGGPSPSEPDKDHTTRMDQHRKIEKVEKVGEVENEQTRKRNKFKKFMEEEPEESSEKKPSPLEGEFYKKTQPQSNPSMTPPFQPAPTGLGKVLNSIEPDPSFVPSPTTQQAAPISTEQSNPLPLNQNFWNSTDTSSQPPHTQNTYNEINGPSDNEKDNNAKQNKEKKGKKPEILIPSLKPETLKTSPPLTPKEKALKEAKEKQVALAKEKQAPQTLSAAPFTPEAPLETSLQSTKKKKTKEEAGLIQPTPHEAPLKEKTEPHLEGAPFPHQPPTSQEKNFHGEEKDSKTKSQSIEIDSPSTPQFPAHIIPLAEAAATQATPYLNPQTMPLFFQMVGTIYMMAGPTGVSKTEIVLNSPSFAHSQFFGSKITIEKYATAPDALNIHLTGTNEAVSKFQENISSLYAAFQKNDFPFRIGRISAEYSIDKPLFRRKDDKGSPGDQGGNLSDERGK